MAEYKNQHYVPQHFLRGWSEGGKISVYHIEDGAIPVKTSISKVCSEDYLYGSPTHVEEEIGKLEALHNRPLDTLRSGGNLPNLTGKESLLLKSFITTQRIRSKFTRESIEDGEGMLREAVREDFLEGRYEDLVEWESDLTEEEKEDSMVDATLLGIHLQMIVMGIFGHYSIRDLEAVILHNVAEEQFVVSNAPVVLDNPVRRPQKVVAGLAEPGLQIFCPIDSHRVLLMYDSAAYCIEPNSEKQLLVDSQELVNQLNLLQFHSADPIVLHDNCSEAYLDGLASRMEEFRSREEIVHEMDTEDGVKKVVGIPNHQIPAKSPDIPYKMKRTPADRKHRPGSQPGRLDKVRHSIYEQTGGFADQAAIAAIQHFCGTLT